MPPRKLLYGKSNSERNLAKVPKEDLMISEHTIVNIMANNDNGFDNQNDAGNSDPNRCSTRVEFHSDRAVSHRASNEKHIKSNDIAQSINTQEKQL